MTERRVTRRALLCGACGASATALAGCSDDGSTSSSGAGAARGPTDGAGAAAPSAPAPGRAAPTVRSSPSGGTGPLRPGTDPSAAGSPSSAPPGAAGPSGGPPPSGGASAPGPGSPGGGAAGSDTPGGGGGGAGGPDGTGAPTAPATGSPTAVPSPASSYLGPASEVPVGGGRVYFGRDVVVTQPSAGRFVGLSATCTHQGREVAGVSGGVVECGYHGSLFAVEDGAVVQGPATKALAPRPVEVRDGDLHLV